MEIDKKSKRKNEQRGASLVEYSMLVALISVVAIGAIDRFGTAVTNKYDSINANEDLFSGGGSVELYNSGEK
jgi:Flp pilus assembly pilin Flp